MGASNPEGGIQTLEQCSRLLKKVVKFEVAC
jgi:hypothetical protein